MPDPTNRDVADRLEEAAHLLREQGSERYRVDAYRRAAAIIRQWPVPIERVFREHGLDGLDDLPGIGPTIARAIRELLIRGRLPMLERLRGAADPVTLLARGRIRLDPEQRRRAGRAAGYLRASAIVGGASCGSVIVCPDSGSSVG